MALPWFSGSEDVASLVAKKSYGRAAKVLRARLEREPGNPALEIQLADGDVIGKIVLTMA